MSQRNIGWQFGKSWCRKSAPQITLRRRLTRPVAAQIDLLERRVLLSAVLGTADSFAVLSGQAVTNTGPSTINGDLGVSPGTAVTGFPPGSVTNGTIHAADAVATLAQSDLTTAYNTIAGEAPTAVLTGQDLGGLTLTPGVYFFSTSAQLTGTLTLDAQGNPNAEFDFQIGSTLTTASNSSVIMINSGDPCDVFWQVGSSATLGTATSFVGHILALTSITVQHGATIDGSALARNGSVTLDDNAISIADCMTGSISGMKFNDLNGDGIQQVGEPGLSGLTVFLDANNNGILDPGETSTTTAANGSYSFPNLFPGTYIVREMQQAGLLQTTPNPASITLVTDQIVPGVNFGDFQLITISGTKFQDTNGNGVLNAGEPGLQGVTIFLDTNNNGILDPGEKSTSTDINGNYTFTNVAPGTYHVREVLPTGFVQTTVNPADIVPLSGTNVGSVTFGNFQTITISGTKFQDTNGNGVLNAGEPGLQGVTIFLDTNNNGILDPGEKSTSTDINGNYTFTNVAPGTYHVREVLPTGFVQTTINPADIVPLSGTNVGSVLFGNFQLINISGTKFQDTNGNGLLNAGEPGLQGVTIFLDTNNNGILDPGEKNTTTDINGNYTFTNVAPGTYHAREVLPTGFVQTTVNPADIVPISGTNVGSVTFGNFQTITISGTKFQDTNGNGLLNAGEPGLQGVTIFLDTNNNGILDPGEKNTTTDINGNYTFTNVAPGTYHAREVLPTGFVQTTVNPADIVPISGTNVGSVTFGNFQTITISGTKFQDTNGNGVLNVAEPGLQGVTIFLDTNNNGILDPGEKNTTTDINGNYTFTNVAPGTYHVREVLPTGFVQTTINPADIVPLSGTNVGSVTFGNFQTITISGTKFQDTNGNGVLNVAEPGLQGVTIFLDTNNNGILDPGEKSTTTDINGNYTFTNVAPGTYHVREVLPTGFVQTTVNPADIVPISGTNVGSVTFGNFQTITISGTKFQDTNGNGVLNVAEPGLQGVTIFLDTNNNGILDPGEKNTTTDINGNYTFTNVAPGTYHVREVLPTGFVQTTINPADIVPLSGTNVGSVTFGNFQTITISGTKFQDTNGNGVLNVAEPGLQGVTIFLDTNNNGILDPGEKSTTTDINGNYTFTNVAPGTYHVREVLPTGFVQTTVNPADIVPISGTNVGSVTFGNFQTITISGTKFQDTNGNGVLNVAEPGLQGVTIFLDTNNNGILDPGEKSTTTDINGNYTFSNLGPATYHVREVAQINFVQMTNNPAAVIATSGANVTGILFGNLPVNNLVVFSKLLFTGKNLTNLLDGTFALEANFVANLYETLLGLAPDINGLTYYLRLLMAGYNQKQVTAMFKADFKI